MAATDSVPNNGNAALYVTRIRSRSAAFTENIYDVDENTLSLLEQVWGYQYKADTRLVNVHVQRLRAKVETDPDNPSIVMTVRGVGYRAGAPR